MEKYAAFIPKNAKEVNVRGRVVTFEVPAASIAEIANDMLGKQARLACMDASDDRKALGNFTIWYVFTVPVEDVFIVPYIRTKTAFPSISNVTPAAIGYERKIRSFFGLEPTGSPDTRSMLLHENWPHTVYPLRKDFAYTTRPKMAGEPAYQYERVEGEGIYEIPVGPIHAGIIEPGHFRFSVAGESIMLLEARLGYVHKGHEKLFEQLPLHQQIKLAEKISGDSSFSHALAFCQTIEDLAGLRVPARGAYLRTIYAELERLANHLGDIGFMMLDTGFNFGGSQGARLREMVMRINERLTGSRFLRGVAVVGGVAKDIQTEAAKELTAELAALSEDIESLLAIAFDEPALLNRLKGTGPLDPERAWDFGAMGVAGRAAGIACDARRDHPYAAYAELKSSQIVTETTGDVYARFSVRARETRDSIAWVIEALRALPGGRIAASTKTPKYAPNAVAIGCVEGWRGTILHVVITDQEGRISRVMLRDPSFVNWQVVGSCGTDQVVPDFPLINKSFNLSYSGNDV